MRKTAQEDKKLYERLYKQAYDTLTNMRDVDVKTTKYQRTSK
jgi:hypothetical protein